MKTTVRMFKIASLAIVLASLVGCASQKFEMIDKPIVIGDKSYTALITERVQPWGTNAVTLNLVESERRIVEQQPQYVYVQPGPMQHPQQPYAPPMVQRPQMQYVPAPQQMAVICPPGQRVELLTNTHVVNNNNQGSIGWANGAFQGAVGDAIIGGSMMGAAALIRPSHTSVHGGSSSSSSGSSSASSAAASASGP